MRDPDPPEFGLAILGSTCLSRHLAAIEALPRLKLVAHCSGGEREASELPRLASTHSTYDEVLTDADVRGVTVCTSPVERLHWIRRSAAAGKHVFSESPVVSTYRQGRDLAAYCRRMGTSLAVAGPPIYSDLARVVEDCQRNGKIGRPLHFELSRHIPKESLATEKEGVLLLQGVFAMDLLRARFGQLDSVYARTRSIGLNRSAEDIAVAQLRFLNGVEGTVQINGLGSRSAISFHLYGSDGAAELGEDQQRDSGDGLRSQYESFMAAADGRGEPEFGGRELVQGLFMVEWLNQSARKDREVYRGEVELG